jgi:outer membrane protein assembly factor BamA
MKQIYLFFLFIVSINGVIHAQDSTSVSNKKIKKGLSFGVLPTITYNSDLGFQYGGLVDLYNYGEGDIYPKYYERYFLEISRFTKGSGKNNFSFESNRLIPGRTFLFDILYKPDEQFDFLGANGYESVYNSSWEDETDPHYKSKMFYKNQTKRLKIKIDILNPISNGFSWLAGLEFFNYSVNTLDVDEYNDGRDEDDKIPSTEEMPGLWDRYKKWGIIDAKNANGGSFLGIKLGVVYDTRNNWTNPTKGMLSEAVLVWVPEFIGNTHSGYVKLNLSHRQFLTIIQDKLSFAYRLGYSGNITGTEPYFAIPIMYSAMLKNSATEGLGGQRTLRGIRRNRIAGDGEAYGNAEFRYKFWNFKLFKQNWYMAANAFMDAGRVVKLLPLKERVDEIETAFAPLTDVDYWGNYAISGGDTNDDYFNFGAEKLHMSYGMGLRIAMNENFVVGLDYGKTTNFQDGDSGMYIGLNYAF